MIFRESIIFDSKIKTISIFIISTKLIKIYNLKSTSLVLLLYVEGKYRINFILITSNVLSLIQKNH
jgi:hypothetical protein